jgi:DNA helicase-2/ATP-dependent DNA helicase PcrA
VGRQWDALYIQCAHLLELNFIGRILSASYDGVFVDEYQDCAVAQHTLIKKLASMLPCRVFGDSLQSIFSFNNPVDWDRDVIANFEPLGALETPHRWNQAGRPLLGEWLIAMRACLERREPILLRSIPDIGLNVAVVAEATLPQKQAAYCRYFNCSRVESVAAIHKGDSEYKKKCHRLAKQTAGRFTSIEEIEGKALFDFVGQIGSALTTAEQLRLVVALAADCMVSSPSRLTKITGL